MGTPTDLRAMELALLGLQEANKDLEKQVERLVIVNKDIRKEHTAELREIKQKQQEHWRKVIEQSNTRMQQDWQRQFEAQRQQFEFEINSELSMLRKTHRLELRNINMEHCKTQHYLQQQIKDLKESKMEVTAQSRHDKCKAENSRLIQENKKLREDKKHLEELTESLNESVKRHVSEQRQIEQQHQQKINKWKKQTKQEGLKMLQTLKSKDRLIESLKGELVRTSRKRKRIVENEGGRMSSSGRKIAKKEEDIREVTPLMLKTDKNVISEEEFSSLTSQDSGITSSAPDTPTTTTAVTDIQIDSYRRLCKDHEVLQRSYQLLRLWILNNNMGNCQQRESGVEEGSEEQTNVELGEIKEKEKDEIVELDDENSEELEQLKRLLELRHKELNDLKEQNELMEFRVLELETKQQTVDMTEFGVDTGDLWDSSSIVTDHMNQLDVFLHSDAEPSEKADAVQEWLDEALSEAWITPVCQHSLVRITNVLRMLQTRLAEAESEIIQGPRYCGSLETIIEEKEDPPKDTTYTQTDPQHIDTKLVRQLEDEVLEVRQQLLTLKYENASLHEQLSNIHEHRTTVSATESELAHLAGSDLSDCDDLRTQVECPYDSIDSVPDKVRMEANYLNLKQDMVIQDFQESGIFEGDESISQTDKPFTRFQRQASLDNLLLSSERKLAVELEVKTKELERVQGDVRQLEHCVDCLRLQLDGGTPCYPLGQGFADILDKVRNLQNNLEEERKSNLKSDLEVELLRESQKQIAKELEKLREDKQEKERELELINHELETTKSLLQMQRVEDDDVVMVDAGVEWNKDDFKAMMMAWVVLSLWEHSSTVTTKALPGCDVNIPLNPTTELIDIGVMTECQQDKETYYTDHIQTLEKQKCQLKKQLEEQKDTCDEHTENSKTLQTKLLHIEEEKMQIIIQFKLLEEALQKEKELAYEQMCKLHKEYRLQIDELQTESGELQSAMSAIKQELEINSSDENHRVINRVKQLIHDETSVRQKVYELEKKESAYRETLQEADKIMASVEARYCDRIMDIESREENLRAQLQQSEQNEQRLRQALRAATKGGEMFKVPDLLEKLIETEGSELKLREQVHRLQQEENVMRIKATETEKIAAELKEELQEQEDMINQMNQIQKQNSLMQAEINSLRTHVKQVEELEDTMRFYKARIEELEDAEIGLKRRIEQQHNSHETLHKRLEQEISSCREELERSTATLQTTRKTNDTLSRELSQIKQKLADTEEELQSKVVECDECQSSSRHEISKLRHQLGQAHQQLSDLEGLNCNVREQLNSTEIRASELSSEICELKHAHEKSLLQLNLQLIQKENEMHQQEEKQLQLDGRELDALSQQESELKNVELRLRSLGQDLQKCCECGVLVAPVLESVTDDLRLLLTLICGEAASNFVAATNSKNIDELESSCEDLVPDLEDEESITEKQFYTNPTIKRVASLEETLRQWELEGDLLQAQLEQREVEIRQQNEELNRQQSVIEHLRNKTIELYQKLDEQDKNFSSAIQDYQSRCSHKNLIISVLAAEAAATSGNITHLMSKLDGVERGGQVDDFNLDLVKQFIQQWQTKSEKEKCEVEDSGSLARRKSLCDLLGQVNWDSIRASSETSLLPPGSTPSKIPRYMPLQAKEAELERTKTGNRRKRVSLSSIHRSKLHGDTVESRPSSPMKPDYRERSPLESSSVQPQPPQDFRITRKVGEDSLLLAWTSVKDKNVAGYQILVNGVIAQHVRSSNRNKALLPGLDLRKGLHLAIRALALPKDNLTVAGPLYAVRYDPRIQYNLSDCHSSGGIQMLRQPLPQLVFETEC